MKIKGVTQTIVHKLRVEIVSGELPGGARLNEIELSNRLGVSRPPLREAFRCLENEGLVVGIPRRGCYVAETSVEDWKHIGRARKMLESTAIEIIAQERRTDFPLMRRSQAAVLKMQCPEVEDGSVASEAVVAWFDALSDFHLRLVESSRNTWLVHCYKRLCPSLARYQVMYLCSPGAKKASIEEHGTLLGMLEKEKYFDAMDFLTCHIDQMRHQVMRNMMKEEEEKVTAVGTAAASAR